MALVSARTDIADAFVRLFAREIAREPDRARHARLVQLGRAAVEARRTVYRREAQLSAMRSAYRARRR